VSRHNYERVPYLVAFQNTSGVRDVYGGVAELVVLECYLLQPETPSDTVLVLMHPIGGGAYLPMVNALARAGHHVIYAGSRYRGTDSNLIMEKVVEDLGEVITDAKNRLGYSKVVLAGWSGGGSLSLYYQQQAPVLDLPPADGIMLLAAHISRHGTLTEWLDASILDESDPGKRDSELDLYNPDNPNQPPYTPEFLDRYRQAQIDRNRRITRWVRDKLAALEAQGRADEEFCFVVHGTMADPRWLDPAVDPNDREPGSCYLGDPDREQLAHRTGQVLLAAQLAVPMELRRRPWRWRGLRSRYHRAHPGDRQPRRRRLHTEPHPTAVRSHWAPR